MGEDDETPGALAYAPFMCGIAGIVRVRVGMAGADAQSLREVIPDAWLDVLDDSIAHRGPDGHGRFRDRGIRADGGVVDVAFTHRRLSIIDHAGGGQPMVSEGKGRGVMVDAPTRGEERGAGSASPELVALVFNGCIYNHRELRKDLQSAGHAFTSDHSDTETLIHGWREWGDDLQAYIEGMYAMAIWDRAKASVWLGRDFVCEKPLYVCDWPSPEKIAKGWTQHEYRAPEGLSAQEAFQFIMGASDPLGASDRMFVFGSSFAGLVRLFKRLGGDVTAGSTLFNWIEHGYYSHMPLEFGCSELEGLGSLMIGGPGSSVHHGSRRPSWLTRDVMERRRNGRVLTPDDVDGLLGAATALRLDADVPVGCFLSGGIDSSLLAVHAVRAASDLRTLTVRMPDKRYDESQYAEEVARIIGSKHTTLVVEPTPAADLTRLIEQLGLPFGDSSMLPSLWVSRAAKQMVKVAIGGDGGDELFAGYERYVAAELRLKVKAKGLRWIPRWIFAGAHPKSTRAKFGRFTQLDDFLDSDVGKIFSFNQLKSLAETTSFPYAMECDGPGAFARGAASKIEEDFWRYLPQDLMRKTDTASMSVGLEVRSPFLDFDLMGAGMCAPISCLIPRFERKGLLRQVARKYFPASIVDRKKMGFSIPIGEWFRSDYGGMRTMLLDHLRSAEPFGPDRVGIGPHINRKFVDQLIREHDDSGDGSGWKGRDHSQRLYMLLVLSIWGKWLGGIG